MAQAHSYWARTKLHTKRMERGLTMRKVEADTGISPARLSEYERAFREPRVTTALKLARYFGSTVEDLFS